MQIDTSHLNNIGLYPEELGVVVVASNILIIVNLIERIASYSNNIAESITFVVQGEIVKHRKNIQ